MCKYFIFLIEKNIFNSKIIENIITCMKIRHLKANVDTFGDKKTKKVLCGQIRQSFFVVDGVYIRLCHLSVVFEYFKYFFLYLF
jgi:hypothetical protein